MGVGWPERTRECLRGPERAWEGLGVTRDRRASIRLERGGMIPNEPDWASGLEGEIRMKYRRDCKQNLHKSTRGRRPKTVDFAVVMLELPEKPNLE